MKLKALVRGMELKVEGSKEVEITGLSTDSRCVAPGNLFLARKGGSFDGAACIPEALRGGAAAIAIDLYDPTCPVPQIIAQNPGAWEARLASRFYGAPSKELYLAAITGTKGKTTTGYLVFHLLEKCGMAAGLIGTIESRIGQEKRASSLTTHFPIQNQKLLKEMVLKGCRAAALEVSSHGLVQGRVDEIHFDAAIFTNLFPDHLDFHRTMEEYAAAKQILFKKLNESPKKQKRALISLDSPWAPMMLEAVQTPVWTFGVHPGADLRAENIFLSQSETHFDLVFQGRSVHVSLPLLGAFNVSNALGAIGIALENGAELDNVAAALADFRGVPGRLEKVPNHLGISVLVDFAHTGESLEQALRAAREIGKGKVICVFGCGGGRDPERRNGMGRAASALADLSIITSDNPRNEEPSAIADQILQAYTDRSKAVVELDRKQAIQRAIELAIEGDIVLIAGKGHEKTQQFAHQTIPFDDVEIAKEALQKFESSDRLSNS